MFFRHRLLFFKLLVWCYWFERYEPHSSRWLWQNNLNIPHVYTPSPSLIYCQEPRTGPQLFSPLWYFFLLQTSFASHSLFSSELCRPFSSPLLCLAAVSSARDFMIPCSTSASIMHWLRYCPWPLCYGSGQVEPWWDKSLRPRGAWPH